MAQRENRLVSLAGALGLAMALLMISCTQAVAPHADAVLTLPNGVTISAAEKAQLEALAPQARAIQSRVVETSPTGGNSLGDIAEMEKGFKELLQKQFGANWKKYHLVTESSVTYDLATNTVVSQEADHFVDPDSVDDAAQSASKEIDYALGYGHLLDCQRFNHWWPWGQNNLGQSNFVHSDSRGRTPVDADEILAKVVDAGGTVTQQFAYQSAALADGNFVWAFWPDVMHCTTYHRAIYAYFDGVSVHNLDSGLKVLSW